MPIVVVPVPPPQPPPATIRAKLGRQMTPMPGRLKVLHLCIISQLQHQSVLETGLYNYAFGNLQIMFM